MDIYNISHCRDLTAAVAISRVGSPPDLNGTEWNESGRGRATNRPKGEFLTKEKASGKGERGDAFVVNGSYRIGEVYRFEWKNGALEVWKAIKAEGR